MSRAGRLGVQRGPGLGLRAPSWVPTEGPRNTTPSPIAYTCPPVPSGSKPLGDSRPRPLPLRPFPPSLSPASWETKGLFIKRIVGGGGGGGRERGSIKTRRGGREGGKERSCAASRGPELRWRPGSPGGCTVDPARPVGTRAATHACQELGRAAAMSLAGLPQPGNTIPQPRAGAAGGGAIPAGVYPGRPRPSP